MHEPVSGQSTDRRSREQLEGDQRGHRISRQSEPRRAANDAEAERRTRTDPDAPEPVRFLATELSDDATGVIEVAYVNAAGGDEEIAFTARDPIAQDGRIVGRNA